MSAQGQDENGPSDGYARARLGAVKTPRVARPRRRRAGGLDRTCVEHRTASIDGPDAVWPLDDWRPVRTPVISLTVGLETRSYLVLITSTSSELDAPSTLTGSLSARCGAAATSWFKSAAMTSSVIGTNWSPPERGANLPGTEVQG